MPAKKPASKKKATPVAESVTAKRVESKSPGSKQPAATKSPDSVPRRKWFRLDIEGSTRVTVTGSFNDWDPESRPLTLGKDGNWRTSIALRPGIYEYRFVVDGEWCNDPRCSDLRPNEFGGTNCVLRVSGDT